DSSARTSSGSSCSARAVDPTRSQNTMVTTLRSSIGREAEARRAPHSEQNFASGAFFEPQDGQVTTGEAYVAIAQPPSARKSARSSQKQHSRLPPALTPGADRRRLMTNDTTGV